MHSIPTYYAGTRYRSRLEARWAGFFTRLGWQADYEPVDLAGYIPDFVLRFERPCIVEVKPVLDLADLEGAARKLVAWDGDALIVGSVLHWSAPTPSAPASLTDEAGHIRRAPPVEEQPCSVTIGRMRVEGFWFDARLCRYDEPTDAVGPADQCGGWYLAPRAALPSGCASAVRMAFASAGNDTQWNRPRVYDRDYPALRNARLIPREPPRSPWAETFEVAPRGPDASAPLKIEYAPRRDR
jgi:hypothetical protein